MVIVQLMNETNGEWETKYTYKQRQTGTKKLLLFFNEPIFQPITEVVIEAVNIARLLRRDKSSRVRVVLKHHPSWTVFWEDDRWLRPASEAEYCMSYRYAER